MPPITYAVDRRDKSELGRNVDNLGNMLNMPALQAFKSAVEEGKVEERPEIFQQLVGSLPAECKIDGKDNIKRPESLLEKKSVEDFKKLTPDERGYLTYISEATSSIESIPARVLLAAGVASIPHEQILPEDTNFSASKKQIDWVEEFNKSVAPFRADTVEQMGKDINRTTVIVKPPEGEAYPIEFSEIDKLPLSGEQVGFLKTCWHQGAFRAGWATSPDDKVGMRQDDHTVSQRMSYGPTDDPLLIDLSSKGQVKVYNAVDTFSITFADFLNGNPLNDLRPDSRCTLAVDISGLKGDNFTLTGCTSPYRIEAVITELDPEVSYGVKLKTDASTDIHDYVRRLRAEGELNAVVAGHLIKGASMSHLTKKSKEDPDFIPNLVGRIFDSKEPDDTKIKKLQVLEKIDNDKTHDAMKEAYAERVVMPGVDKLVQSIVHNHEEVKQRTENAKNPQAKAVIAYCQVETDLEKRDKFAAKQFDKFSENCTVKLNDSEQQRISSNLVSIMRPLCQTDEEVKKLEKNADKLVRECASEAGMKKSWSQAWNSFKDKVGNIARTLFGKENEVSKIKDQYQTVMKALKSSMEHRVTPSSVPYNKPPQTGQGQSH